MDELGAMRALWFRDPGGMQGEVCLVVDPALRFQAPRPLRRAAVPTG